MAKIEGTYGPIDVSDNREIVETDSLKFPWKQDRESYFLIKIENGVICCGFIESEDTMSVEFRGSDPYNIIKEIAKRKLVNLEHMGYVAAELVRAKHCLDEKKEFVQR